MNWKGCEVWRVQCSARRALFKQTGTSYEIRLPCPLTASSFHRGEQNPDRYISTD